MREARRLMPGVGIQIPPNLADWWPRLVAAGATDLGGLSANGDHISPEHPFPSPSKVRKRLAAGRLRADGAALRLPAVHRPGVDGAGRARRGQGALLELHPAPRLRPARRPEGRAAAGHDRAGPRRRGRSTPDELTALFAETRPEVDRGHAPGRRRAARRAGGRHGHVRRQPQHQRLEHLRRRLRVLRLRAGQALARRLHALRGGDAAARARGGRLRRDGDLHAVRHPPGLDARGLPGRAAHAPGRGAAPAPARVLADGDRRDGGATGRCREVFARAARRRARLAARAPRPRCSTTASARGSARTSCRSRAGSRSSRPRTPPGCAPR